MNRFVHTAQAPPALGPYSQAVVAGDMVFTAGQVGIDPTTNRMVEGGIAAQTRQALENLARVLEAAGTSVERIVKATVFLADLDDFQEFNTVYAEFMGGHRPARSTVQVARLPAQAKVEIEFIATRY